MSGLKNQVIFDEKRDAVNLWIHKRRRRVIIFYSLLNAVWILALIFCCVGLLKSEETIGLGIYLFFLITFLVVESILVVSSVLYIKNNTISISSKDFCPTEIIEIKDAKGKMKWVIVDEELKKFVYKNGLKYSEIYNFNDLISCDVYEKNYQQLASTAGSAAIGGFLFGVKGAIVGSSVARKIENINSGLCVLIYLNNQENSLIIIDYIQQGATYDTSSSFYLQKKTSAQVFCSELLRITGKENNYFSK